MSQSKSQYVCQVCGLAVHYWRGGVWKHAAGSNSKSCGRPPKVVERAVYEADMDEWANAARDAIANRIDLRRGDE